MVARRRCTAVHGQAAGPFINCSLTQGGAISLQRLLLETCGDTFIIEHCFNDRLCIGFSWRGWVAARVNEYRPLCLLATRCTPWKGGFAA